MSSIFVQIPAYHDFELPKTIYDALDKKSGSHQINFGIHHSFYKEKEVYIPKLDNIKILESEAPTNIGLGLARNLANSLYDGEDYYLQIDAHTRFDHNWDRYLISYVEEFKNCGISKPLLSTYPGVYRYTETLQEFKDTAAGTNWISFKQNPENFKQKLIPSQTAAATMGNVCQSSISGGYVFTVGDFSSVGYNNKVAFWGEEILIAAMAWTRGFDLLIPPKVILYHLYYDHSMEFQRNGRRHAWKDFSDIWENLDTISKAEIYDILSTGRIGPEALGSERSLEDYGIYAGLDFKNGLVTQ